MHARFLRLSLPSPLPLNLDPLLYRLYQRFHPQNSPLARFSRVRIACESFHLQQASVKWLKDQEHLHPDRLSEGFDLLLYRHRCIWRLLLSLL